MDITWPSDTVTVIDKIRTAIGREVIFNILASSIACTICSLDPVTNTSTDSFCPVCSGVFWIPVYSGVPINAHINWGGVDQLNWATGGQYFEGDCTVQIKYTIANLDMIDKTTWITVDNKVMEIIKHIPRGVQPLNRIILDLREKGGE